MTEGIRIAVTGGHGFLGWHTSCRLRARNGIDAIRLGRAEFADRALLAKTLNEVDAVIHLAGVNRAGSDAEVEDGNVALAESLVAALGDRPLHVVYGNSVQQSLENAYGRGKRRAGEILRTLPGSMADIVLPNLFGEHGRPAYNSFVATFCHEVAHDGSPEVREDREVPLLHAQAAAQVLIDAALDRISDTQEVAGEPHRVSEVLEQVRGFHALYATRGEVPDLSSPFAVDLFNTYRSYLFPARFPIAAETHDDPRGRLFETLRSRGGTGQAFVSTTTPGAGRGEHYHLRKVERFFVIAGEAEISLRRLLHDEVVTFRLSGERPAFVDMPTMWVHALRNVGTDDLVTMFWTNQLLDSEDPDQYAEEVSPR
jgi:UDP-2-acetamido-2,6-beta-L-arabino-hexul-4-ose reductase